MSRRFKDYALLYSKGLSMGVADVIPGVSGGTIAFITGIYSELVGSIREVDLAAVKLLVKFRFAEFWKKINGNFLISVLAGVGTSLVTLAGLMTWLLENHPVQVWSFFFGLILVSAPLIFRDIDRWNTPVVISLSIGVVAAYLITILSPAETPNDLYFIFFCGALAICAMILPGISGAFILLLIGKYQYMINALITLNLPVVLTFIGGCLIGITSFSHVLNWMLSKHKNIALALLSGFMLGSLNKVWPWKEVVSFRLNHAGEKVAAFDRSVLPGTFGDITGKDPMVLQAVLFALAGIVLVMGIEWIAGRMKNQHN